MKTTAKIFLCWSKRRSKSIAEAWARLLPLVIKDIQPIVSTEFQKGKDWPVLLRRDLTESRAGIVFLTPENVDAPWIHFEAGALATAVQSDGAYSPISTVSTPVSSMALWVPINRRSRQGTIQGRQSLEVAR
jgi:hypothetical protein